MVNFPKGADFPLRRPPHHPIHCSCERCTPVNTLPTFQQMRQDALRLLGDALDVLRSDWDEDHGPTPSQALALDEARHHIGRAKAHLDRAAR